MKDDMKILSAADKEFVIKFYQDLAERQSDKETAEFYNENTDVYEKLIEIIGYRNGAVQKIAKRLFQLFDGDVSDKYVIDIGAGTGVVGEEMSQLGFKNLDGLDMSKYMLENCRGKGVYRNLYPVPLECKPTKNIEKNRYDAAISSGCFFEGHISLEALSELIRMVKPGGYIMYTLNDPEYKLNYMEVMGGFIRDKKVQLITMELMKYKREWTKNFEFVYCFLVIFKVL